MMSYPEKSMRQTSLNRLFESLSGFIRILENYWILTTIERVIFVLFPILLEYEF